MPRYTLYRPWFPELARWMARSGLTLKEIAVELHVHFNTLTKWRKTYPEFSDALNDGKDLADARVADALYQRAVGIFAKVKTVDKRGEVVEVDLYEKPDVTACIFWLKNRRPNQWRDAQRLEHTGKDGQPIEVKQQRADLIEELTSLVIAEAEGALASASQGDGQGEDD
jgi:hypothetical protein